MSLPGEPIFDIPELTVEIANAAFPTGNTYMRMRDEPGVFYDDKQFTGLFSHTGQPAIAPWRLALVTVMQFAENLTDRQAAAMDPCLSPLNLGNPTWPFAGKGETKAAWVGGV